jgi:hypothetical protein
VRRVKHVKLEDYVLLARWRDKSFQDPWEVGFIAEFGTDHTGQWYRIQGSTRRYRHCWKISEEEGAQRFEDARAQGLTVNESKTVFRS